MFDQRRSAGSNQTSTVRTIALCSPRSLAVSFKAAVGGGTRIPAPSNLVYAQPTIAAIVTIPIMTDTPAISGTVTSYSVAPELTAGLSLNQTSGAISGTPSAVAASGTYTITASNSTGSTTAVVKITVSALQPPSNLVYLYPQATIAASPRWPFSPIRRLLSTGRGLHSESCTADWPGARQFLRQYLRNCRPGHAADDLYHYRGQLRREHDCTGHDYGDAEFQRTA